MKSIMDSPRRLRMLGWLAALLVVLLGISSCSWVGLLTYLPFFDLVNPNLITRAQGKVELLAPAKQALGFGQLSPDGRWMVMQSLRDSNIRTQRTLLWNLTTGVQIPLQLQYNHLAWLDAQHFVAEDVVERQGFALVNVEDLSITTLTEPVPRDQYLRPDGFQIIAPFLKAAHTVYSVESWGAGYMLFLQTQNQWQFIRLHGFEMKLSAKQLDALVATIPHIDVPTYARISNPVGRDHTFSPNGQFYVTTETLRRADVNPRAAIYTRDGTLVAEAYKAGWEPYVLGWAEDGSGIYLHFTISGGAASMIIPYRPLYKLSPYTAAEQRWQQLKMIALWVSGGVLLAIVGWWWHQRRGLLGRHRPSSQ